MLIYTPYGYILLRKLSVTIIVRDAKRQKINHLRLSAELTIFSCKSCQKLSFKTWTLLPKFLAICSFAIHAKSTKQITMQSYLFKIFVFAFKLLT